VVNRTVNRIATRPVHVAG